MRKSKFSEARVFVVSMSSATYLLGAASMAEFRETKSELRRLKRMYADLAMKNELVKEALGENEWATFTARARGGGCEATWCIDPIGLPCF